MNEMMFAAISGGGLVNVLITLIVVGLICGLLWWLISYIGLPAPFDKVCRIVVALIAVIFICNALLSLTGHGFISW